LLASDDCKVLAGQSEIESNDTVWIGAMFPLSIDLDNHGDWNAQAVDLGRQDFAQAMGAFAGSGPQASARQFGLISCDDGADPDRVARHLVDDARVPAIIGFRRSTELITLAQSLFIPKGVMAVTATNTSPLIATLPHPADQPRLVWRTTYNAAETELPAAIFVEQLEPKIREEAGMRASDHMRVALLRPAAPSYQTFADIFFRALSFNGMSALANGANYREFLVDDDQDPPPDAASVSQAVVGFSPHVVVAFAEPKRFPAIETGWPTNRRWRPTYIELNPLQEEDLAFVGSSADRRHRLFGITTVSNTPANARLVMHFNQTFHTNVDRTLSPNTAYDAFYLLAYATYALGDKPVTGLELARAVTRLLPPGKPVEVGPSGIFDAFNTLRTGGNIDLVGSTGNLDFDAQLGDAPTDEVILCAGVDENGKVSEAIESGLVYNAATKKLDGQARCP
jgi:branched-chain amino acid transport system substrate-binding protein